MDARESWREERSSVHLYRVLAELEPRDDRAALFAELARAAEEQAETWAGEFQGDGAPAFTPGLRVRVIERLLRVLGPRRMLPVLAAAKVRGISVYRSGAPAPAAPEDSHPMPTSTEMEQRHRSAQAGGNLRAAVFGVNDGLVSNTCLLLGVAGADPSASMFVVAGTAGLLAGAFSMAAGEYVSVRTQRELFEYQIELERAELERYPEEEAEELALIYAARGVELEQARACARRLLQDPEVALDTLAREELGLDPEALGSPLGAALSSFAAFGVGALLPLLPYLLGLGEPTGVMLALAGTALFAVGAALSLFTGRGALRSGLRMLAIGSAAGAVTWALGSALGETGVL